MGSQAQDQPDARDPAIDPVGPEDRRWRWLWWLIVPAGTALLVILVPDKLYATLASLVWVLPTSALAVLGAAWPRHVGRAMVAALWLPVFVTIAWYAASGVDVRYFDGDLTMSITTPLAIVSLGFAVAATIAAAVTRRWSLLLLVALAAVVVRPYATIESCEALVEDCASFPAFWL